MGDERRIIPHPTDVCRRLVVEHDRDAQSPREWGAVSVGADDVTQREGIERAYRQWRDEKVYKVTSEILTPVPGLPEYLFGDDVVLCRWEEDDSLGACYLDAPGFTALHVADEYFQGWVDTAAQQV